MAVVADGRAASPTQGSAHHPGHERVKGPADQRTPRAGLHEAPTVCPVTSRPVPAATPAAAPRALSHGRRVRRPLPGLLSPV